MVHWHLGLQLVHVMCSLAKSFGVSHLGCKRSLSILHSSLDLCFYGCGLAEPGFKHALQVLDKGYSWFCTVAKISWLAYGAGTVARRGLVWILHFHVALGPQKRQDVIDLQYFLRSLTIGMWLLGVTTYVSGRSGFGWFPVTHPHVCFQLLQDLFISSQAAADGAVNEAKCCWLFSLCATAWTTADGCIHICVVLLAQTFAPSMS